MNLDTCEQFLIFSDKIKAGKSFTVTGLTSFLRLILLCKAKLAAKKIIFITNSEQTAIKYKSDLYKTFGFDAEIFPTQNTSLYDTVTPNLYDYAKQVELLKYQPDFLIMPVKSLLEKFPTKDFFNNNKLVLKKGMEISHEKLLSELNRLGYKRATMVSDITEFSIRGDIADIFSLNNKPVRIEFWGDEIVDIRFFDNETQKSVEKIEEVEILPIYKFILDNKIPEKFPKQLIDNLENEKYFEGIEVYQSYFNKNLIPVSDYFNDYIFIFDEMTEIASKFEQVEKNYDAQLNENLKTEFIYPLKSINHVTQGEFFRSITKNVKVSFNNFIDGTYTDLIEFESANILNFNADADAFCNFIKEKQGYQIVIATDFRERVKDILKEHGITNIEYIENISANGTILKDAKIVLLTDKELFNKRSKEITATKKSYYKEKPEYIENINDIKEGDFVVHSIHGVGIYVGLSQQEIDGQYKDYLTIEYANKDKLHIPAEQINLLCRYRGAGNIKPKLSRMGGGDWENTKTKVKKEVETIAYDLLRLYARRKMQTGIQFEPDTTWQVQMEEAFEYIETPDQMRSINEIKSDMESPNPMDRLICGDVGFGKTEVAMRAAFKAVTSGKQVAVIVPTTVLALQHYQTFSERFKPFGVNVDLMCRFKTLKERNNTLKRLSTGECEVVIATHGLLLNKVQFKDLGLLIIDEEHKFGVRHKEKIKQIKENIDIISMSATPIPRTLYMSLSGIKDMSVINTPPSNRLPIKTYVGAVNENIIKNAITHELDRDGQVLFLYNRVETIKEFKLSLEKLLPGVKIGIGHAQLPEHELENVIVDFLNREYDVLLCTTIIENGLDIPNANTIIIYDADKFGLAQLYQLRGRVGRSERQAYCYCLYKNNKQLTSDATQRLQAIKEFASLGSGYQIALRDIEIRGIGNILGTKQHGHMVTVGFDTYCQLLEETINELRGEKSEKLQPAIIDINVTAFISDDWVGSVDQKMIEYKRLADVKNEAELNYILLEWKDRFSKIPESVENLIKLIKLRLLATDAGITLVRETSDNIRIYTTYTPQEWKLINSKISRDITKHIKGVQTLKDGYNVLLLNNNSLSFDNLFNILSDLFYNVKNIVYDFKRKEG